MGTKVMVRASRSFNNYVEGDWYMVDPSDPHEGALIAGGYLEHQEHLFEGLTLETLAAVEYPEEVGGGEVAAEPGEHPEDGTGAGPGTGDSDGGTRAGHRKKDRSR
jgi:hypothetical protein